MGERKDTMKVGMISFAHGHAHSYARALKALDGVILAGIADPDPERGQKCAQMYDTTYYADIHDLLATDIEAVVIASENALHHEHVIAAAQAGKHILCEKPLAVNSALAQEMIDVCADHGVILQTAFPVRFNSPVAEAKQIVASGKLGDIIGIKGTNRGTNPGGWFVKKELSGGGAVIDHTVHVVDLMRWFTGAEVTEVYAEIGHDMINNYGIDDCGIITMQFDNGMFATLDCSWSRNPSFPTWGDVTMEIIGTEGTLSVNAFGQKVNVYNEDHGAKWHAWGDNMDFGLIEDFIDAVRHKREPSITGLDGMRAVEVAEAAYRSAQQKAPVKLR